MILFIVELLADVKYFGFYIETSSNQCYYIMLYLLN